MSSRCLRRTVLPLPCRVQFVGQIEMAGLAPGAERARRGGIESSGVAGKCQAILRCCRAATAMVRCIPLCCRPRPTLWDFGALATNIAPPPHAHLEIGVGYRAGIAGPMPRPHTGSAPGASSAIAVEEGNRRAQDHLAAGRRQGAHRRMIEAIFMARDLITTPSFRNGGRPSLRKQRKRSGKAHKAGCA